MKRNRQPQKGKAVAAAKAESPKKKRKITKTELPPFKAEPTKETTPKVAKLSGKKNIKKPQSAKNKAEKAVVAGGKVLPKIAPEEDFAEAESESEEEVFSNAEDEEAAYWESVAGEFEDDDSDFAGGDFAEGGFSSDEELDEKSLKALRDEFGGGKDEDENDDEEGSADEKGGDEKEADEKPEEEEEEEEEGEEKSTIQRDATGANMKVTAKFAAAFGKILEESQQEKVQGAADPILTNFRLPGKDKRVEREKKKRKEQRELVIKKRLLADKDHLVPTHLHTLEEKALRKLATRGVVALFNAVKKQQQQVPEITEKMKAKNPETVEKLSKAKFLELLQQAETSAGLKKPQPSLKNEKPQTTKLQIQQQLQKQPQARKGSLLGDPSSSQGNNSSGSKQPNWDVLRDDFMMGAKLKDFDKAEAANNNKK